MEKIKSVTALPDWFRNRVYRKNLSDLEWFREIRIRERCASILKMFHQAPKGSKNWILDIATGAKEPDPKSLFFFVPNIRITLSSWVYYHIGNIYVRWCGTHI